MSQQCICFRIHFMAEAQSAITPGAKEDDQDIVPRGPGLCRKFTVKFEVELPSDHL